jgi:hypothetical protein
VQALHAKLKLRLQPSRDRPAAPSALESGSTAGTAGLASAPAMAEAEETRETVWDSAEVVLSLVCEYGLQCAFLIVVLLYLSLLQLRQCKQG